MRSLPFAAIFLLLSSFSLAAQTPAAPEFEEEVDVNLVLIDAIVTDSGGDQILGLGKEDFVVREDGVVQEIESVDYYTNRRLLTSPEAKAEFDVERVQEPRYFIFFFDKFSGPSPIEGFDNELWRAVRASKEFVEEELLEEDYVAVLGHDARLEIYTDFTRDQSRILEALEQARRFGSGNFKAAEGPSIVENLDQSAVRDSGWVWDGIELLGQALQPIRGRKVMLMFSPGLFGRTGGLTPLEDQYYDPMVQALNAANTSVYGLNLVPEVGSSIGVMNLTRLVDDTGGDYYRHPVNYLKPLQNIENRNNGYYLITYRSEKPEDEHGYQEVDVSVKNPEFRVEARDGYVY